MQISKIVEVLAFSMRPPYACVPVRAPRKPLAFPYESTLIYGDCFKLFLEEIRNLADDHEVV